MLLTLTSPRFLVLASALAIAPGCDDSKIIRDPRPLDMAVAPDLAPTTRALTLLYTNDEHSHLFAFGPEADDHPAATSAGTGILQGGVARRFVLLNQERAAAQSAGAETLTVSAGDNTFGTLSHVEFTTRAPDYTIMKQLGYDVTCLGNHEFDFGPAPLAQAVSAAAMNGGLPQIVASNIHFSGTDSADDTLEALYGEGTAQKPIKRYHVVTTPHGLKVGFFGILGSEAAFQAPFKAPVTGSGLPSEESNFPAVRAKIYADIRPVVDALRNVEKVDLVVALSHSGVDLDRPENGDDYNIAQNVAGIDVIISGHSHTVVPAPIVVKNTTSSKDVIIVQSGSYGRFLGRLALSVSPAGAITFDAAKSVLLPVDDKIVPDPAVSTTLDMLVSRVESTRPMNGSSFLERAITHVLGSKISDDSNVVGDLYFYKLGTTTFPVGPTGTRFVETNMMNLATDGMMAAGTVALPAEPPDVAIHAAGVIRADIDVGKSGTISFADAFRAFPLGFSPADGSMGYPLVHAYLWLVELKAAFELSASLGLTNDAFFLGASGMRVTVDTTRPAFDFSDAVKAFDPNNGRVTKIEWDSQRRVGAEQYDTVLFDVSRADPWTSDKASVTSQFHVITNLYIASFAASAGVKLKDKSGNQMKLTDTIIKRTGDSTEVKDYEGFAAYVKKICDQNSGNLPDRYDAKSTNGKLPRRLVCTGPVCGKY